MHESLSIDTALYALEHIKMLQAVHCWVPQSLYEGPALELAIYKYKTQWLPALDKMLRGELHLCCPTLDVSWVWYLHKIDQKAYEKDCIESFGRVLGVPTGLNPFAFYPMPSMTGVRIPDETGMSGFPRISADIQTRAKMQSSFLWYVRGSEFEDLAFLADAEERYVRMLGLSTDDPLEEIAPSHVINLIKQTHMAFPTQYDADTVALASGVFGHNSGSKTSRSSHSSARSTASSELYSTDHSEPALWFWEQHWNAISPMLPETCAAVAQPSQKADSAHVSSSLVMMGAGFGREEDAPVTKAGCGTFLRALKGKKKAKNTD